MSFTHSVHITYNVSYVTSTALIDVGDICQCHCVLIFDIDDALNVPSMPSCPINSLASAT